jgi:ASC-1-like (ASCH) protein
MTSKTHHLKLHSDYFKDVKSGLKTFEIRKNDRDYQVGDRLILHLWHKTYAKIIGKDKSDIKLIKETSEANADKLTAKITYLTDYQQKIGYVVLGIEVER